MWYIRKPQAKFQSAGNKRHQTTQCSKNQTILFSSANNVCMLYVHIFADRRARLCRYFFLIPLAPSLIQLSVCYCNTWHYSNETWHKGFFSVGKLYLFMFLIPAFLYEILFRQWNDTVLILIMPLWIQALVEFIFLDSRDALRLHRLRFLTPQTPFSVYSCLWDSLNLKS